jgi:hypothetical protein
MAFLSPAIPFHVIPPALQLLVCGLYLAKSNSAIKSLGKLVNPNKHSPGSIRPHTASRCQPVVVNKIRQEGSVAQTGYSSG